MKTTKVYTVHDRLTDQYYVYKHMSTVSKREKIPYNTLVNKFGRDGLNTYVTKDAKVITKTELI